MPMYNDQCGRSIVWGLLVLLLCAGPLALLGCSSDGNDRRAARATDLENQVFTFADGTAFGLAGQTTTLAFRDFDTDGDGNPNTGPFTLTSAANTATGTVTLGSCDLGFNDVLNTFDPATLPQLQPGQTLRLDPCAVDTDDGHLQVQNVATGAVSISDPPNPVPTTNVAFVLTEGGGTGSYAVIDLESRTSFNDIALGGVHSDALPARFFNGRIYVVNRLGVDSIQVVDPQQGYTTPQGAELSVGNGSDPHDIAFISSEKAYVSRFGAATLLIINPTTLTQIGEIDLSSLFKPNDPDGLPEMDRLLVHNGLVYLTLEHLDRNALFAPLAAGEVVVLDPTTDTIRTVIPLQGMNPFSFLQFSPALNRILVSTIGSFGVADGGIEAINPDTLTVDPGFIIEEATIGGDITHFEVISASKGFAIMLDSAFNGVLVSFNPSTGERLNTLFGPLQPFIPHFAINRRNELYLAVNDDTTATPGVRIFDTVQETEIGQVPTGALPPSFVLFVEE
jgi:hypothetical protein